MHSMNSITGKYTTKRDGGIEYTYEASWTQHGNEAAWDAKVRRDGQWAGHPDGRILDTKGLDLTGVVTRLVETTIEIGAGVT
jgi:hypothetical protein